MYGVYLHRRSLVWPMAFYAINVGFLAALKENNFIHDEENKRASHINKYMDEIMGERINHKLR